MAAQPPSLILASRSPRRRELLAQIGVAVSALPADIDETPQRCETPGDYVARIARGKVAAITAPSGSCVLGADTAVVIDDAILGKPADAGAARHMLQCLSGRTHRVYTAVALRAAAGVESLCVETHVTFRELTDVECDCYLASGEPWDKAGAYGIQGLGGALVARIDGSYSNVVGLPLCETLCLLRAAGVRSALDPTAGDL